MPPFLFKLLGIVIGILIWKAVVGSFRKAKNAMDEDDDDAAENEEDVVSRAQLDQEEQWRQAAKQISCMFDPGKDPHGNDASITGRFSGHSVTVKRFGRNYVRYFVGFRCNTGIQVCVVRDLESIAERILDGQPIFPSKHFFPSNEPVFYCSAQSEDAFDRFLDVPSNRSAVLNLVHLFPSCMFNMGGVSVRLRASTPDISVLDTMIAIANALENPSQTPMPDLTSAPRKRFIPVPPVPDHPAGKFSGDAEETPKRFPPIQVNATTRTSRIRRSADAGFSGKTTIVRITPESRRTQGIKAMKAAAAENPPEKTEPSAEAPVETVTASRPGSVPEAIPPADSLSVESVCAALFSKPFPGTEERAAFDAMKGRRVGWSGQLLTVLPFNMDFVFGSRKGVKGTFLIHRMVQSQFGSPVPIKAVAAFPLELQSALESGRGKTVLFEGELLKFEPFAHELYLQNAALKS